MRSTLSLIVLVLLSSCGGGDPADFTGSYSLNLTNRENGCGFDNWTEGQMSSNIAVTVTQDGAEVQASAEGLVGLFLDLVLGAHVFAGDADGNDVVLELFGTRSVVQGNCSYTLNAVLDGELDGDILVGEIRYQSQTNGSPDCGSIEGCVSRQDFNGARPPSE